MIRPCHDLALIRPRPDIEDALHGLAPGSFKYTVTSRRDQFAFGEVVALGRGTPYGSGRERPEVVTGGIIGFDLGQVGHVLPNGLYTLMWKNMLCRVATLAEGDLPIPLCSQVVTVPDEVAMGRLVFSGQTSLIMPGTTSSAGIATSDVRKTNVKLRAERVVAVGQGEFVRKVFYETGCKIRDIACYTAGATVHTSWHGKRLAFTPWSEIVAVIDGS
jgi:co-chaperonin GroES (HSP10)